ncbi:hypothetical protein BV898_19081 [Hypsibius exemplaris]|uniref:Protein kinase domain-containing protein n=1 Tax=Hypsibius exemplaris TaxID=2072580 RepID=A0A9X6RP50_HYPEX|nr:hypothetical protein BV898_19081 [Hypsibius exemplaris]
MSPEMLSWDKTTGLPKVSQATDMWSLACVVLAVAAQGNLHFQSTPYEMPRRAEEMLDVDFVTIMQEGGAPYVPTTLPPILPPLAPAFLAEIDHPKRGKPLRRSAFAELGLGHNASREDVLTRYWTLYDESHPDSLHNSRSNEPERRHKLEHIQAIRQAKEDCLNFIRIRSFCRRILPKMFEEAAEDEN